MATLTITLIDPSTGQTLSGLTNVKLYYGTTPLVYTGSGIVASALVGSFTEEGSSGSYSISITYSNQYSIVVAGTSQDEYTDVWIPAGDICSTTRLLETGAGSLPAGSTYVGVNDPDNRFSGATVQAILEELAGARVSPYTNSNIHALAAWRNSITAIASEINALASSGVVLADIVKLHAITATAALINQALASISGNVTSANLNTLTAGATSDAITLHKHSIYVSALDLGTTGLSQYMALNNGGLFGKDSATDAAPILNIQPGVDSSGDRGDVIMNLRGYLTGDGGKLKLDVRAGVSGGGVPGGLQIHAGDDWYDVITEWEMGDMDFSNTQFLSQLDPADYGLATRCFRELDGKISYIYQAVSGQVGAVVFDQSSIAPKIGTTKPMTVDLDYDYCTVGTSLKVIARFTLPLFSAQITSFTVRIKAKVITSGTAGIYLRKVKPAGYDPITNIEFTSTDYVWYSLTIPTAGVNLFTSEDPEEFMICAVCSANTVQISENILIEVSH
jgi:hypothetical protein